MDLFFGTSKNNGSSKAQPTVSIRVEERVVRRKQDSNGNIHESPVSTKVQRQQQRRRRQEEEHTSPAKKPRDQRPAPAPAPAPARSLREEDAKHAPSGSSSKADRDLSKLVASGARDIVRPVVRRLAPTSGMSARDSSIVNSNRERVGSLPGTPRPRKTAVAERRLASPVKRRRRDAAGVAADDAIERSASVPAHLSQQTQGDSNALLQDDDDPAAAAIVSSVAAVRQSSTVYEDYFEWAAGSGLQQIDLHLPAANTARETFSLAMPRGYDGEAEARDEYLPVNDLLATVRAIGLHLVDSAAFRRAVVEDGDGGIVRRLERARNRRDGDAFVEAVRNFNALLDGARADGLVRSAGIAAEVAVHVLEQVYNRVVAPTVDLLRQYKAFSNNVYGEILPTLVSELIARTGIGASSTFVDLGCGIGNVVLQVAAQTGCRACGIEIMRVPARFARRQAREFEHRMRLYGLRHGAVRVWQGDFCDSADVQCVLPVADVLLVNNYAFDSALNQTLLQMFLDLKEGTRIVSLRPFVTPDYKISARNVHAPESILTVRRYPYWSQCVSWTDNGGEYFVQTVDRSGVKGFLSK